MIAYDERQEDGEKTDRPLAPESLKTQRARKKLLEQWEEESRQITPQALRQAVDKIHKWIADNAKHRVPVEGKSIGLFNMNQNAAEVSRKVKQFAEKLRTGTQMQNIG